MIDGNYTIVSNYLNKTIPFKNNIIHGVIKEKYKMINIEYEIRFNEGLFNNCFTKINGKEKKKVYILFIMIYLFIQDI